MSEIKSESITLVDIDSIIPNLKIDPEDVEKVVKYSWHKCNKGYARATTRENGFVETIRMHRYLMGAKKGEFIDHINMNKLDNRKSNLRICTSQENQGNTTKRKDNTSGYKGVSWHKSHKKFCARMMVQKSLIHIGYFETAIEAGRAYDVAAKEWYGQYFRGNNV